MNRPIKFRAWDSIEKKMKSVSRVSFGDDGSALTIIITPTYTPASHDYLVDGESGHLMQFTGLLDSKGKEIYEGDIVQVLRVGVREEDLSSNCYEVIWVNNLGCFSFKDTSLENFQREFYGSSTSCEIIGNIFENPEHTIPS